MSLRGIAAAKRAYGESSPIVANALSVRASVLESLGRLEESSAVYRTTLAMTRRLLGPAHGTWATTAVNYAELPCRMERWREAADLSREVLASRGTSLDDTSYPVQAGLLFLGRALAHLDSAKVGERCVREVGVGRPADVATWQARLGQKGA